MLAAEAGTLPRRRSRRGRARRTAPRGATPRARTRSCGAARAGRSCSSRSWLYVRASGAPALDFAFFTEPLPYGEVGGGVFPALFGTLLMVLIASARDPARLGTAIYLSEYGTRQLRRARPVLARRAGRHAVDRDRRLRLGAGRPPPDRQFAGLAGAVALAVIMIPIVTRRSRRSSGWSRTRCASLAGARRARRGRRSSSSCRPPRRHHHRGDALARSRRGETAPLLFTALRQPVLRDLLTADGLAAGPALQLRGLAVRRLAHQGLGRRARPRRGRLRLPAWPESPRAGSSDASVSDEGGRMEIRSTEQPRRPPGRRAPEDAAGGREPKAIDRLDFSTGQAGAQGRQPAVPATR